VFLTIKLAKASLIAMKLALDKMNRLVLPKKLRDHFALGPGKELEVSVEPDGIRLRPVTSEAVVADKKRLLVCTSEVPKEAWDLRGFIEREREARARHLASIY
jgi:AbrB family looped-hinge helix DNA binding protein